MSVLQDGAPTNRTAVLSLQGIRTMGLHANRTDNHPKPNPPMAQVTIQALKIKEGIREGIKEDPKTKGDLKIREDIKMDLKIKEGIREDPKIKEAILEDPKTKGVLRIREDFLVDHKIKEVFRIREDIKEVLRIREDIKKVLKMGIKADIRDGQEEDTMEETTTGTTRYLVTVHQVRTQ